MGSALTLAPAAHADDPVVDPGTSAEPSDPPAEDPPPVDPPETPADPGTDDPADPPADDPADESTDPAAEPAAPERKGQDSRASTEAAPAAVTPDYGYNKFRVGVQIEDGRYVPDGVTTLGSQIRITEAGPNVPDGEVSRTCTTTLVDPVVPTTTYCEDFNLGDTPLADFVVPEFGDTVTITQITVNDGLQIVDGTKIDVPECNPEESPDCLLNAGDILLTDAPPPPNAVNDEMCMDPDAPISLDVLANDDLYGAPLTAIDITDEPRLGTVTVTGTGDNRKITYTPGDKFDRYDNFDYMLRTANGSAGATVRVLETGWANVCPDEPEPEAVLPDTGGSDPWILGTGLALVVGGGSLVAAGGRQRRELRVVD